MEKKKPFLNLLDLLGLDRVGKMLFNVRPELKNKAEDVKVLKENCSKCNQPRIIAWEYYLNGERHQYKVSSVCTVCSQGLQSKIITDELIEIKKTAIEAKWYKIPDYDQCGFKNYEATNKVTTKALEGAKDYIKAFLQGKHDVNLLLMGSTGTGKSHLAKTIAKTAKHEGLNVAYIEAEELFNLIKATFNHNRHNEMLYAEYKNFHLVVIDDVGLETKKIGEVNWSVAEWTKLLNAREGKATVYTTNFDDTALAEIVGQRAFSRMYSNTRFIDLFTDDYRKRKIL